MAGFVNWVSGQILNASDLMRLPQHNYVIKSANETVTSSTTMQDDNHLFLSVGANTDYFVEAILFYNGPPSTHLNMGWSGPTSATFDWTGNGITGGNTIGPITRLVLTISDTDLTHTGSTAIKYVAMPRGVLRVAGTSGTFRFRWAQGNSNATAVTVFASSFLRLTRLS